MGVKYSKYVVIDVGANLMTVLRVAASIFLGVVLVLLRVGHCLVCS